MPGIRLMLRNAKPPVEVVLLLSNWVLSLVLVLNKVKNPGPVV